MNETERKEAWKMIMDIAEEAGFIQFAYAGVAVLNMNEQEGRKNDKRNS